MILFIPLLQYCITPLFFYPNTPLLHGFNTPSLLYQVALNELREHRDHHELDVPSLAKRIRVMNHILSRKTEPDWKFAELHNLGDVQAEGDGPGVACLVGLPVRQDVAGISDTPAIG